MNQIPQHHDGRAQDGPDGQPPEAGAQPAYDAATQVVPVQPAPPGAAGAPVAPSAFDAETRLVPIQQPPARRAPGAPDAPVDLAETRVVPLQHAPFAAGSGAGPVDTAPGPDTAGAWPTGGTAAAWDQSRTQGRAQEPGDGAPDLDLGAYAMAPGTAAPARRLGPAADDRAANPFAPVSPAAPAAGQGAAPSPAGFGPVGTGAPVPVAFDVSAEPTVVASAAAFASAPAFAGGTSGPGLPGDAGGAPPAQAFESGGDDDAPHGRRRRMLVVWGVTGAVLLAGAGVVAAKTLTGGDGSHSAAADASPTAQAPAVPTAQPPATSADPAPTTSAAAPSSTRPSTSPSGSKSASASASASGSKSPGSKTDDDGDGITDDPGAKDPSKLNPDVRTAWGQVKTAMAADGITLTLNSGKRSYQHQQDLWNKEVRDKGSEEAARMRVLPPGESSHVKGFAIDVDPAAAQNWLKTKGAPYGWCQMYTNESWHFEYQAKYKTDGCPGLKAHP
ncbi:D-alanyl-D-alanine carboxypeptidase family protein [Yinghuangia seranimata]|uniref:D-alanyl-D-alanine carboxypeptidase family protein n=1 Tax=Yinghuangia seranimata TaxID=408067 RepID=UPI00248CA369|nr:D-alanyl-D-alanine carboxypeptidase family protein [Yinghuangia seranimata]MDI2126374.1 D-alanyl-D-alanine carboxypeptidase family protein [Yinghuangia seranimata]